MPYFPEKHVLFIHIPKTGGRTLSALLSNNDKKLLETGKTNHLLPFPYSNQSLQHQFYNTIYKYRDLCGVKFNNNLRVISIVRNPYNRCMSGLFFNGLIQKNHTQEKIHDKLKLYLDWNSNSDMFDNHNIPQYKFVTDDAGKLVKDIVILRTETLNEDAKKYGFEITQNIGVSDTNIGIKRPNAYKEYLNKSNIMLINKVYMKDFELFNYDMLQPS